MWSMKVGSPFSTCVKFYLPAPHISHVSRVPPLMNVHTGHVHSAWPGAGVCACACACDGAVPVPVPVPVPVGAAVDVLG